MLAEYLSNDGYFKMIVSKNSVVSISYDLFDLQGELIEQTSEPIEYLHGGFRGIFELVEQAIEGKKIGDNIEVKLEPSDAFGDYDESLLHLESADKFPKDVEIGMQFEGQGETTGERKLFRVTDIADGKVVVDGNHPLAGKGFLFKCKVEGVREATEEEISHGHVHGPGGHHH